MKASPCPQCKSFHTTDICPSQTFKAPPIEGSKHLFSLPGAKTIATEEKTNILSPSWKEEGIETLLKPTLDPTLNPEAGMLSMKPEPSKKKNWVFSLGSRVYSWMAFHSRGNEKVVLFFLFFLCFLGLFLGVFWPTPHKTTPPVKQAALFTQPDTQESTTVSTSQSTFLVEEEKQDLVTIQLRGRPKHVYAFAWIDGKLQEGQKVPFSIEVPKNAKIEVTFAAPNYEPKQLFLTAEANSVVKAKLSRRKKAPSPKKASPARKRKTKSGFFPGKKR